MSQTAAPAGEVAGREDVRTLAEEAFARAARAGDARCMRVKRHGVWHTITWAQYTEQILACAYGLAELGVEPGDRVAVHAENRPEWLVADVGCVALRAVTVGLYPTSPPAEVAHVLRDSGARVLIAEDQEQVDKALAVEEQCPELAHIVHLEDRGVADLDHPKLVSWRELLDRGRRARDADSGLLTRRANETGPDEIATLVYTSGTTGPPKGAMLTHRNIAFAMDTLISSGGIYDPPPNEHDVVLSYLPLCHVAERAATVWNNARSGVVVHFAESVGTVQHDLREVQPTLFFAVPRIWEKMHGATLVRMQAASILKRFVFAAAMRLAGHIARRRLANGGEHTTATRLLHALGHVLVFRALRERLGLRHVRAAACGAAPIAPEILTFFLGIGVAVHEVYGLTENAAVATANRRGRLRIGTVGEPFPGTELRLDGDTGEILNRHPAVFAGYFNRPDETAAVLDDDGWLHTGDVGEWVDGTHLRIVDRLKDVIITAGGKNIAPAEIEHALKASPYIKEAAIVGDRRPYLTALIGIDRDTVAAWADRRQLAYTTHRDLASRPEVVELIAGVVRGVNRDLARAEQIRKFRVLPRELGQDNGELTATQKVRRHTLHERYAEVIEDMYAGGTSHPGGEV